MLNILREKYGKKALLFFLICSVSLVLIQALYIDNLQNHSKSYAVSHEPVNYNQHKLSSGVNNKSKQTDNIETKTVSEKIELSDEMIKIKSNIDINNPKEIKRIEDIHNITGLDKYTSSVIVKYSKDFQIPVSLILAIIDLESNFKKYEVGDAKDRGYCQIIPGTEKWLIDTYGDMLNISYNPDRIFEPDYNIGLCVLYLNHLLVNYNDNYHRILSEYNRGPYNLRDYYNKHKTFVTTYSKVVLSRREKYLKFDTI